MKRCRHCNGPVSEIVQPEYVRAGLVIMHRTEMQTCQSPDCPLYDQTIDHSRADLAKYGATQHPDWLLAEAV